MVNENEALSKKRRRGPATMNGRKTYASSWGGNILCKYISSARARCWERREVRKRGARTSDLSIGVTCDQVNGVWTKEVLELLPRFGGKHAILVGKNARKSVSLVKRTGHEMQTMGNILGEKSLVQFLESVIQLFTLATLFPPGLDER